MSLGSKIREARKAEGKTQQEVAELLRVSVQAVSQWETDKTVPTAPNLIDLTRILGVSLEGELPLREILDISPPGRAQQSVRAPLVDWDSGKDWSGAISREAPSVYLDIHWKPVGAVFALRVPGYLMAPIFKKGDIVIIDTGRASESGDFVVAAVEGREKAFLATYKPRGLDQNRAPLFDLEFTESKTISVTAANPGYVIGTVREHRRFYRTEEAAGEWG